MFVASVVKIVGCDEHLDAKATLPDDPSKSMGTI
jgi:hypothetical protein